MNSLYPEFALYGGKHKCARTVTFFIPIYEICIRGRGLFSGKKRIYYAVLDKFRQFGCSVVTLVTLKRLQKIQNTKFKKSAKYKKLQKYKKDKLIKIKIKNFNWENP